MFKNLSLRPPPPPTSFSDKKVLSDNRKHLKWGSSFSFLLCFCAKVSGPGACLRLLVFLLTHRVVYVCCAGPEIDKDLVQMLQKKLDEAVLEQIWFMLERNHRCKLTQDDVGVSECAPGSG